MKFVLTALLLTVAFNNVLAQKLSNVQQASVKAPPNIKIDGNLNEWNNKLQAYNTVDGLYYTISNDDKNLYLSLIAPYKYACEKILRGGVLFSVSKVADKKRKDDPKKKEIDFVLLKLDQRNDIKEYMRTYLSKKSKNADSLLRLMNKKLGIMLKTFDINRDIVPVYNDLDITGAARFNENLDLVYELSVPLSYVELNKDYALPFSYNICLSAADATDRVMRWKYSKEHPTPPPAPMMRPGMIAPPPPPPDARYTSSDFWGTYTLAK